MMELPINYCPPVVIHTMAQLSSEATNVQFVNDMTSECCLRVYAPLFVYTWYENKDI